MPGGGVALIYMGIPGSGSEDRVVTGERPGWDKVRLFALASGFRDLEPQG
jgi:hypothetical protein